MLPVVVAVGSVLAGATLGLAARARHLVVATWISAVFAVVAVGASLVPEAVAEVGAAAVAVAALGALAPWIFEVAGRRLPGRGRIGLELAYAALLLHQLGDGVAIGAIGSPHLDHRHEVGLLALGGHGVALAAVFVLAWRAQGGVGAAIGRAAGMAVAVVVGALMVPLVPGFWIVEAHPWVAALTAGLLVHVAVHPLLHRAVGAPDPAAHART